MQLKWRRPGGSLTLTSQHNNVSRHDPDFFKHKLVFLEQNLIYLCCLEYNLSIMGMDKNDVQSVCQQKVKVESSKVYISQYHLMLNSCVH